MGSYMGLRPMPRSRGAVSMGLRAPQWIRYSGAPRPALRHERRELYMGLRPMPHSRTFLGKSPRDPKKPNRARYILSNIDSEQGCRRQPCFAFCQSISSFIVSLPTIGERDAKGLLSRQRTALAFRNWQSISSIIVSLPNVSKGCEGATVPAVAALTLPRPV